MPNHCNNHIVITGPSDSLRKFWDGLKKFNGYDQDDSGELSIVSSYFPMLEELQGTKSPGDNPNWYDWACENWGTKWGDYDTCLNFSKNQISGDYITAWGPCDKAIVHISKLFPDLTFEVNYNEPGMGFIGCQVCKNGEEIDSWNRSMTRADYEELGYGE